MKTECILNLLVEKGIVTTHYGKMNRLVRISEQYKFMKKDIIGRLIKSAQKNNDYMFSHKDGNNYLTFVKISDIDTFIETLNEEINKVKGVDYDVATYINNHYEHIEYTKMRYGTATFINLQKRQERLKKENETKDKILELLDGVM